MHALTPTVRLIALLAAVLLTAGACSSGSDEATTTDTSADAAESASTDPEPEAAEPESTEPEEAEAEPASGEAALSCDAAGEASAVLRGANGWLPQVVDAETNELIGSTDGGASVLAAIETLRAIQDVEGPLGTMREGLDNMELDVVAVNEGRFDDKVGGYSIAAMNAVIGEEIC